MPTARTVVGFVIAAAIGLGGGYYLGHSTRDPVRKDGDTNTLVATATSGSGATPTEARQISTDSTPAVTTPVAALRLQDRFRTVLDIDSRPTRSYEIEQLFASMTVDEAPEVLSSLLELSNRRERLQLLGPFFDRWGRLDGPGAVEAAGAIEGRDRSSATSSALTGWAKNDPYAAWEAAREFMASASPLLSGQARGVVTELAKRDLGAAIAALNEADHRYSKSAVRYALLNGAFETEQINGLLAGIGAIDDPQAKEELMLGIFTRWGEMDTGAPLDALSKISDEDLAKKAMEGFLQGWAQTDTQGALDYALSNFKNPLVADAVGPVLRNAFYYGSEEETLDLAARVAELGMLDEVAPQVISGLVTVNPQLAVHMAGLINDEDTKEMMTLNAVANWSYNDFDEARAYFERMPASPTKTKILASFAYRSMERDDGGALIANWMKDVPAGKDRTKAVESLLATAANPYTKPKPEFLAALKAIAAGETDLSEDAIKHRDKLFDDSSATTP